MMSISSWPLDERPREKLIKKGPQSLSDAELLAIFLRTGTKGKTAVDLARELLQTFKHLRFIFEADQSRFCAHRGLGTAKYVQLQACIEMVRRYLYTGMEGVEKPQAFLTIESMADFLISQMCHQKREVFSALFLDKQFRLRAYEEIFMGSLSEVMVYPRELVKRAFHHNAAAMVIAHNHPSGWLEPSKEDKQMTRVLKEVLSNVEIDLLDHVIIGERAFFSFHQKGLL